MNYDGCEIGWVRERLPRVLPSKWRLGAVAGDGASFVAWDRQTVIVSGAVEQDGKRWLHVSTARPDRLPSYDDMVTVKEMFIGREAHAISVMPPRAEHVNIHVHCLHLWHCLDGSPLPDFTRGGRTI